MFFSELSERSKTFLLIEEVFDGVFIILLIYIALNKYSAKIQDIGINFNNLLRSVFCGFIAGITLWFVFGLIDDFVTSYVDKRQITHYFLEEYIKTDKSIHKFLFIVVGCFITPISEEALYRGLIYTVFKHNFRKSVAIILTSLLFSMEHFNIVLIPSIFIGSVVLIFLYEYNNSLISPIIAHSIINGMVFIFR